MINLLSLLNLAEQGEPGEAANARRILDKILSSNNLTIDDIRSPATSNYSFHIKNKIEKKLLIQIVGKILDVDRISHTRKSGSKKLTFKLTQSQAIDIGFQYHIYLRELRQLIEDTLTAFISKNYIYGESDEASSTPTDEELKAWDRASKIANALDVTPIYKELT